MAEKKNYFELLGDTRAPSAEVRRKLYKLHADRLMASLRGTPAEIAREQLEIAEAIYNRERKVVIQHGNPRKDPFLAELFEEVARTQRRYEKEIAQERRSATPAPDPPRIPPIDAIPEQVLEKGIAFRSTPYGPLDLVRDPPTDPHDNEQSQLYANIRRKLRKLKEDIPTQERSQINDAIDDFLDRPENWNDVEYKKLLWLSGNTLRALLAKHDAAKDDHEHYSRLPPPVAEALRNPVQAWSIFVQGDPQLALLDKYSLGPQEQQRVRNSLVAAEEIVSQATRDRRILTKIAADAVETTLVPASPTSTDIYVKLAQEFAHNTSKNLFSEIIRRAYLLIDAIKDPNSDASKSLGIEVAKGAASEVGKAVGIGVVALTTVGAVAGWHQVLPYLEFIATNASLIKQYILIAFQNLSMIEIVDALEFEYNRLKAVWDSNK
jgi:hypothetical protein